MAEISSAGTIWKSYHYLNIEKNEGSSKNISFILINSKISDKKQSTNFTVGTVEQPRGTERYQSSTIGYYRHDGVFNSGPRDNLPVVQVIKSFLWINYQEQFLLREAIFSTKKHIWPFFQIFGHCKPHVTIYQRPLGSLITFLRSIKQFLKHQSSPPKKN